jgi:hypothetical protein
MPLNAFFDGLDSLASAGRFFVDVTQRLADGKLERNEDINRLSRTLGITVPPELTGSTIRALGDAEDVKIEKEKPDEQHGEQKQERVVEKGLPQIIIKYPPEPYTGSGQIEKKFKKCFEVCQSVGKAKVCFTVCVEIDVGLGGVHGSVSATVTVKF